MWSGWVKGNSNGPLVRMERLVPIENDVIPMVLLVNMHPLVGVKMLLPIEIDGSFLKTVLNWQILYCCSIDGVYCQKQSVFYFINWVPSFRKANVSYREIVTYRQKFRHVLRLDLQHRSYQEFCWSTSSLWQSSKYNIRNKNLHRFICLVTDEYLGSQLKSCSQTSVLIFGR